MPLCTHERPPEQPLKVVLLSLESDAEEDQKPE